jgi:hypothetical protein
LVAEVAEVAKPAVVEALAVIFLPLLVRIVVAELVRFRLFA